MNPDECFNKTNRYKFSNKQRTSKFTLRLDADKEMSTVIVLDDSEIA